jgi:hypothetical protein
MKKFMMPLAAVFTGMLVAFITIMLCEVFGHLIYPVPEKFKGIDFMLPENKDKLLELMAAATTGSKILLLIGYMIASFVGGWVASLISKSTIPVPALIIGGLLTVAGIMNLMMIPHDLWFAVINVPTYLAFAWIGAKMVKKKRLNEH